VTSRTLSMQYHRAIFYVFEAYGFPEKDVDLI
jgi:hypothetical protein